MVNEQLLLEFGGATRRTDLAVEILGIPEGSKEWMITAEISLGEVPRTPDQLNWFYSDAVDSSFVYVPDDYRGGLIKLREVEAVKEFDRIRLSLVRVPWAKREISANDYPRLHRCRYAAHRVSVSGQHSTLDPIHLLGEITR
ncbi:hypothetical protein ACWGQ2_15605 [Arthrobacter sp. NPDC055585]